jgi:hypothetical protein
MEIRALYDYETVARLVRRSYGTVAHWVSTDKRLPPPERRFPGAGFGEIPLADVLAFLDLTVDELRELDEPGPAELDKVGP